MFNYYKINYQISDLNSLGYLKKRSKKELCRIIDILVIDDEDFILLEDLRKHEFNIEYKNDISSLKDVEPYHIILCDLHGVGKFLGSNNEGAYLVNQIKEKYPTKIVVAYTGDATTASAQKYLQTADFVVSKGTPIEDWASILVESIQNLVNPIYIWKRIAIEMMKNEVPTREIAIIESRYVESIKAKKVKTLSDLIENKNSVIKELLQNSLPLVIKLIEMKIEG